MTRTAIRHSLSALAAVALVSTFANSPTSAQGVPAGWENFTLNGQGAPHATVKKPRTPKGLITQRRPPVACDCTNCSAAHCNLHLEGATNLMGW
jgi:hypothetical protein